MTSSFSQACSYEVKFVLDVCFSCLLLLGMRVHNQEQQNLYRLSPTIITYQNF